MSRHEDICPADYAPATSEAYTAGQEAYEAGEDCDPGYGWSGAEREAFVEGWNDAEEGAEG